MTDEPKHPTPEEPPTKVGRFLTKYATLLSSTVLGIAEVTKQDRQLAKALNFGLVFGMGADTFRLYAKANYGLDLSETQAQQYRNAFFKSYPGLAAWHPTPVTQRSRFFL